MSNEEIARESADKMRRAGAIHAFTEQSYVEEQFLSALTKATEATDKRLGDLLARIHRDGGHYQAQHGTEKACEDADTRIAVLNVMAESRAAPVSAEQQDKPDGEVWICGHVRKCGWRGRKSELVWKPDIKFAIPVVTGCCPNCGGSSFYKRQPQKERTG